MVSVARRYQKPLAGLALVLVCYTLLVLLSGHATVDDADQPAGRSRASSGGAAVVKAPPRRRLALLIYGVRLETLFETGRSIRRFIVDHVDADVFVYGREVPEYNTSGAVRAAFGSTLKGVFLGKQLEEREIDALVAGALKHKELMAVCGGTNMLKAGTLNGLVWSQLVYELAASYERQHGFRYDYMMYMRPDVQWFAPFPPMERLDAQHQIWLPTRTPWGGIPASCILCPRGLCHHWAAWWELIRNGTLVETLEAAGEWKQRNCLASEMLEWSYWKARQVPFGWFSVVYAVVCTHTLCKNGDQCYLGKSICAPGQKFKYDGQESWFEATLAQKNAVRIRKQGWTDKEFTYNCHTTVEIIKQFRRDFRRTGIRKMMPLEPDANALHPEPPWSPVDGSVDV